MESHCSAVSILGPTNDLVQCSIVLCLCLKLTLKIGREENENILQTTETFSPAEGVRSMDTLKSNVKPAPEMIKLSVFYCLLNGSCLLKVFKVYKNFFF